MDNQKPINSIVNVGKTIGKSIIGVGKGVGKVGFTVLDRLTRPIELNILPRSKLAVLPSVHASNTNTVRKPQNKDYGLKRRDSQRGGKQSGKKTKRNMRKRGTQKRR
jgi:hypothetical protein